MPFHVQQDEDLEKVRPEATELLQSTRPLPQPPGRFDWLYRDNPDGPAVFWSVREADSGELAGFTVALPRRMLVDGKCLRAWNCADFSVRQRFRTLGVALKLRRAATEGVEAGQADFLYAHPNERMEVVHQKVGHKTVGPLVRLAKVLRADGYVRQRIHLPLLASLVGLVTDPLLELWSAERRHRPSYETRVVSSCSFDERFDELFDEGRAVRPVIGVRDARYLNWRHARNPFGQTDAVLAERGGRLRGYALFQIEGGVAHLRDVFAAVDEAILRDLLAALVRHARAAGLEGLSAVMLEGHPGVPVLEDFGFVRRVQLPHLYSYAAASGPWRASLAAAGNWFLTAGDRDV